MKENKSKYNVLPGPHQSGRRTENPETFPVWLFLNKLLHQKSKENHAIH